MYKIYEIKTNDNTAVKKNEILKLARSENVEYCFIKNDDIEVKDESVFEKYCQLMDKYKTGVIFYGYYKRDNRIFNGQPNPSLIIRTDLNNNQMYFNRMVSRGLIGINLKLVPFNFDENFKVYELEEFILRCNALGVLPLGNGFYMDIPKAWENFSIKEGVYPTHVTDALIKADKAYIADNKLEFKTENNVDELLKKMLTYEKSV